MPGNPPNGRRRAATWVLVALAIGITAVIVRMNSRHEPAPPAAPNVPAPSPAPSPALDAAPPLLGEEILDGYGSPDHPPSRDLELVDRLLFSYRALVKNHTDRPVGTNADFADVLLGKNPAKHRFLPDTFPHLSPDGELLDRWGTPLFVHPEAADRIELRSAGPDRQLWTDDDIIRPAQ